MCQRNNWRETLESDLRMRSSQARSPPQEAQAESISTRLKLGPCKEPNQELSPVALHVSHPPRSHFGSSSAPRHYLELGTEKPKVTRGDRLEHQRTLVDLILGILASRGGSLPSAMAVAVGDGIAESRPCSRPSRIVSIEIISAQSLPRATRPMPRNGMETLVKGLKQNNGGMGGETKIRAFGGGSQLIFEEWKCQNFEEGLKYELKKEFLELVEKEKVVERLECNTRVVKTQGIGSSRSKKGHQQRKLYNRGINFYESPCNISKEKSTNKMFQLWYATLCFTLLDLSV
ncbi:hypothetical protein CR513_32272, partial [Mucuna pruriens]